jgi:hypothetical protein
MPEEYAEEKPSVFLAKVRDALLRAGALIVLDAAHWCIEKSLDYFNHFSYRPARTLLDAAGYGAFALVYVYLLWDMLKIFVPWLRPKPYPGTERQLNEEQEASA